jgi:hypothetical protein
MYIHIDVTQVPPLVELHDADDFKKFHVVLTSADQAWVDPEALVGIAGRSTDPRWQEELAGMVRFAESKGWLQGGRIRAHVETVSP